MNLPVHYYSASGIADRNPIFDAHTYPCVHYLLAHFISLSRPNTNTKNTTPAT